jgi:hypothetical protein
MSPRREPFETKDGSSYVLYADIDDVMSVVLPIYWADSREDRRERGWAFRGQASSDWDLIPSLYRPPIDATTLNARQDYTDAFLDALRRESTRLGLTGLSDTEYLAIAQHYGFYTPLLDLTWNVEVAAYFATLGGQHGQIGVIFPFSLIEYEEIRNPFSLFGLTVEESDELFKEAGKETLPDVELVELYNVPRVYEQEGLFMRVTPEKTETLMYECPDRFFFRQRASRVYEGKSLYRAHGIPGRHMFDSDATYETFLADLREEHPDLFDRTESFGTATLFPPADPLSKFAERWKQQHPDPLSQVNRRPQTSLFTSLTQTEGGALMTSFSDQVDRYYYGDYPTSPYQSEYLAEGRKLLESLCGSSELNDAEVQRWLLWELIKRNLAGGLKCTLKLGNARSPRSDDEGFRFTVVDRWLADSYQHTLSQDQLQNTFSQITFGMLSPRGRPEISVREVQPFAPPATLDKQPPSNPHKGSHARDVLNAIESRLVTVEQGVVGSFLYDFHHAVMLSMGRNLELTAALVERAPCLQRSPLVRPEHADGPALLVRLADRFTGGVTHTAVCAKHWDHMSAGDVDLMSPNPWMMLGLA